MLSPASSVSNLGASFERILQALGLPNEIWEVTEQTKSQRSGLEVVQGHEASGLGSSIVVRTFQGFRTTSVDKRFLE